VTPAAVDLRIAYFITSYGPGDQLLRLVQTLRAAEPGSPVVIHHDSFQRPLDPSLFDDIPHVHFLTSEEPIIWGDMTLEAARWRVFRWILKNLDVDWVMLLSEQDYPVAPLRDLRLRLAASGADAVIRGQRIEEIEDAHLRHECDIRYRYKYYSVPNLGIERRLPAKWQARIAHRRGQFITVLTRYQRWLSIYTTPAVLALPARIGIRQRRSPFSHSFPCWYNDCWFALSKNAMQHVVDYIDQHPGFARYYSRTVIPLESATATILFNDQKIVVENSALHAIRWSDAQSGRPDVFTSADLDYLTSSGAVFARKFGAQDTDVLDQLDPIIMNDTEEKV